MSSMEEQRISRKQLQDACEHHTQRWYSLTATDYVLCLDCGKQFPVEGEENNGN